MKIETKYNIGDRAQFELKQAAWEYYLNLDSHNFKEKQHNNIYTDAFEAGARWADEHPQFDKEAFMEKACWWLRETAYFYVSDFTGELDDNGLLEDFKKAMEE